MSRQQSRRQRLLELAKEQYLDDAEGLFMTEEQRESLLSSFISVKLEFHDLDGLHWTQTALRKRQKSRTSFDRPSILPHATPDYPFTILTNTAPPPPTSSSSYDAEATIRASPNFLLLPPLHSHQSPRITKRNKRRPPITSKSFWIGGNDTLSSSFPLPPPPSSSSGSSSSLSLPIPPSSREGSRSQHRVGTLTSNL